MSSKRKKEDKEKSAGVVTPDTPEVKELIPNRVSEAMCIERNDGSVAKL